MTERNQRLRLERALKKYRPAIRKAFIAAVIGAATSIDEAALAAALENRDVTRAIQIARLDDARLYRVLEQMRGAFVTGGETTETVVPRGIQGVYRFDGRAELAEQWVTEHAGQFVQGIQDEQIDALRKVIEAGIAEGRSSKAMAVDIVGRRVGRQRTGGFLGLTSQQADSIVSGRAKLASGDPKLMREYLRLKLRDRRFDSTIRKAIKEERPIGGPQLSKIIDAHRSKALAYRGKVIAKQESHTALAQGQAEGMRQIADRDDVEAVTVKWVHGFAEDPRLNHLALDGTRVELGETFDLGNGIRARWPHDENLPASETIGCSCTGVWRVRLKKG